MWNTEWQRDRHTHTHRRAKEIFHLTGSLLQCLWKSGLGKVEARSLELCPGLPHGMGTSTWDIFHCIPKHTSRQQDWDWSSRPASLTVPQYQILFKVTVSLSVAWLQHSCLYLLAWQSLFLKFSFLPGILMILPSWVLVNSPSSPPPHSPPSGSSLLLGLGVIPRDFHFPPPTLTHVTPTGSPSPLPSLAACSFIFSPTFHSSSSSAQERIWMTPNGNAQLASPSSKAVSLCLWHRWFLFHQINLEVAFNSHLLSSLPPFAQLYSASTFARPSLAFCPYIREPRLALTSLFFHLSFSLRAHCLIYLARHCHIHFFQQCLTSISFLLDGIYSSKKIGNNLNIQ